MIGDHELARLLIGDHELSRRVIGEHEVARRLHRTLARLVGEHHARLLRRCGRCLAQRELAVRVAYERHGGVN